ncbi:hypothetical protein [Streptomyces formicae]|uniref:Uncharacterized protein n=1 Tax=Streptomyces formicae TaxID=1616117 RepID=A0A291Q7X6_9ACTN|nr:hypothetical protein [Streptomyces formicae]ATL27597.1 hypothetical protein KY5_2579 [Streptomyces formicae]
MSQPLAPIKYLQWDGTSCAGRPLAVRAALSQIRQAVRQPNTVVDSLQIHTVTDRTGAELQVIYVHWASGFWSNAGDLTEIYEVPAAVLRDFARASTYPLTVTV